MPSPLIETTGIDVLDQVTGGQLRPGGHLLIGPIGVGKTTLLVQLLAEQAWTSFFRRLRGGDDATAAFVFLEERVEEIQRRLFSFLAQLPREMMEGVAGTIDLPEPLPVPDGVAAGHDRSAWLATLSVPERLSVVASCVNGFTSLVDLRAESFDVSRPSRVVTQRLTAVRESGRRLSFVGIDHSSLIMQHHFSVRACDDKNRSHRIKVFVMDLMQYGKQTDCPVWVVHQASGVANTYRPDQPLLVTDAKHCKGLGEVSDVVVTLGNRGRNYSDERFQLVCARRPATLGAKSTPRWVAVDREIAAIVPTSAPPQERRKVSHDSGAPIIHDFWVAPTVMLPTGISSSSSSECICRRRYRLPSFAPAAVLCLRYRNL
jgi:hypothetical protein